MASVHDLTLNWIEKMPLKEKFLLIAFSEDEFLAENIQIDQEIYFLTKSFEVQEKYVVNGVVVERFLGYFLHNVYHSKFSSSNLF